MIFLKNCNLLGRATYQVSEHCSKTVYLFSFNRGGLSKGTTLLFDVQR